MASELASAVESFTIDSMIRGYHVYKDVWSSFIGEVPSCRHDVRNHHDRFAVAVCKGTTVVGHVIRKISAVCCFSGEDRSSDNWHSYIHTQN